MSDDEAVQIARAEERVRRTREMVARQVAQITRSEMAGRSTGKERKLLHLFESSLRAFEDHVALLSEPLTVLTLHRC